MTFSLLGIGGAESQEPGFSFEMVEPATRGDLTLPTFSFVSADSGAKVDSSMMTLPVLSLAGVSFAPQYGEHRLNLWVANS